MNQIKRDLIVAYNKIGNMRQVYRRKLWPEILEFLKSTKPGKILDLGSGGAQYAKEFESYGHNLVLSDFSIQQLKSASKRGIKNPAIAFDITDMPIKDSSFDIITALAVLHHLSTKSERIKFFKEIKRVLKPQGKAIITALYTKGGGFSGSMSFGAIDRYYHFYSKEELVELLETVNFKYKLRIKPNITSKVVKIMDKNRNLKLGNFFIMIKNNK